MIVKNSYDMTEMDTDRSSNDRPQLNALIEDTLWAGRTRAWNEVHENHADWPAAEKHEYARSKTP